MLSSGEMCGKVAAPQASSVYRILCKEATTL